MAWINPFIKVNAGGIPTLEATSISLNGNNATYTFKEHRFLDYPYRGLLVFKLPASTAADAGTVTFKSGNSAGVIVYDYSGAEVSSNVSTLLAGGVFLAWYSDSKLLLFNV